MARARVFFSLAPLTMIASDRQPSVGGAFDADDRPSPEPVLPPRVIERIRRAERETIRDLEVPWSPSPAV